MSRDISRKALVKLLGEAGATHLLQVFGGARIYLPPPDATPGFPRFAAKVGEQIARALHAEFGSGSVHLPPEPVPLDEEILRLGREMLAPAEIARRLDCTERYVSLVLSRQSPQ
ncbi:MAG: hypothetical protein WA005_03230 [Candidatus Binataceae bacterium]